VKNKNIMEIVTKEKEHLEDLVVNKRIILKWSSVGCAKYEAKLSPCMPSKQKG
jgi:predicted metal-binding protein